MEKNNLKAWLYLLPAILFLGVFMVYPLVDVLIYSFEEGFNSASQSFFGVGFFNYDYILRDPYFLQAIQNTLILVGITVPVSTGLALLISVGLASIKPLRNLFQTIYFLPYVTNTLAVGLVFMILFKPTAYTDGLVNIVIQLFGGSTVDFIAGPYWAKMTVLCIYTVWVVLPFKILVLTGSLASVRQDYYDAAKLDGTRPGRTFWRITMPMRENITIPRPTLLSSSGFAVCFFGPMRSGFSSGLNAGSSLVRLVYSCRGLGGRGAGGGSGRGAAGSMATGSGFCGSAMWV